MKYPRFPPPVLNSRAAEPDLMDSFEWNKIAGAVLGTLLFLVAVRIASGFLFEVKEPAKPGYLVQGVEAPTGGAAQTVAAEEPLPDWGTVRRLTGRHGPLRDEVTVFQHGDEDRIVGAQPNEVRGTAGFEHADRQAERCGSARGCEPEGDWRGNCFGTARLQLRE